MEKIKIVMSELPSIAWWGDGITAYPDNDMVKAGVVPNQTRVIKEHKALVKVISDLEFDVIFIPFSKQLENTNKEIVICNMRLPQRLEETDFVKDTLRELGYTIKILPKNECIAEGGEFFYLPNENILLSGCSRNNKAGAETMAELMGVNSLHIIYSQGYHLDTAISPIFDSSNNCIALMCAKEVFDDNNYKLLRALCKQHNWELLSQYHSNKEESLNARTAMNCLTLPGLLVGTSMIEDKRIMEFVRTNQIEFIATSVSQFNLSGGSVHCLTNELF